MANTVPLPDLTPALLTYDDGPFIIRMSIVMGLLATLFVCLRLWARRHTQIKHGLDDWIIIAALAAIYGYIIIGFIAVYHGGAGKHLAVNLLYDPDIVTKAVLYLSVSDLLYATSITLIKASILVMYCRMLPTRSVKIGGSVLGAVAVAWWFVVCLLSILQCRPIQKAWGLSTTEGTCIDKGSWFTGVAVPNIVTDAAILTLPIREVSRLHLSRARKMAVVGIFLLAASDSDVYWTSVAQRMETSLN